MADYIRELSALLMLSLVPLLGIFAWRTVRRRRVLQERMLGELVNAETPINSTERQFDWVDGFYVATTFAEDPLQRVWAHGLGARGRGRFLVSQGNVFIERTGEPSVFIPANQIVSAGRGTATVDRVTESGGLLQINWLQNGIELVTSLRILSSEKFEDFNSSIRSPT